MTCTQHPLRFDAPALNLTHTPAADRPWRRQPPTAATTTTTTTTTATTSQRQWRVRSAGLSDVGKLRLRNEDYFIVDDQHTLYAVADGIASAGHGEVAATLTLDSLQQILASSARSGTYLDDGLRHAHSCLKADCQRHPRRSGMGCTVAALRLHPADGNGEIAHVGDSRIYRLRGGKLRLLTTDHTVASRCIAEGLMSADQANQHPMASMLTRAVNFGTELKVEWRRISVTLSDRFLICSDGLNKMMCDDEMLSCLHNSRNPAGACKRLVRGALKQGGHDNVTVLVVEIA